MFRLATRGLVLATTCATVFALAACSHDNGSPADAASSSAVGAPDSATGSTAESAASDTATAASGTSAGADTETAMATTSESPSSRKPKPTPSSPAPSGTATVGAFSAADIGWFDAMCAGLANKPRDQFAELSGDLTAKKTEAAKLLTDQAARLDNAAKALKSKPAPKVTGGDKLAAAVIAAFPKSAEAARAGVTKLAAATSDDELQGAFDQALDAMNEANAPLDAFDEMMGAPAMVAHLKTVPACAPLVN